MLLLSLATIFTLVLLLGSGVWIAFALIGTAWIALQFFSPFDPGPILASDFWGASYGWDLTALPMFIWMGEILFRSGLADNMFRGLSPWLNRLPGRLLHTNIIGSGMFAAVCGSSAATCATVGKMTLPELERRGYDSNMAIGTLASASTLDKDLRSESGGNIEAAAKVGALLAERAKAAGIEKLAFDRSGFRYHGRIKALADAARANGLVF